MHNAAATGDTTAVKNIAQPMTLTCSVADQTAMK